MVEFQETFCTPTWESSTHQKLLTTHHGRENHKRTTPLFTSSNLAESENSRWNTYLSMRMILVFFCAICLGRWRKRKWELSVRGDSNVSIFSMGMTSIIRASLLLLSYLASPACSIWTISHTQCVPVRTAAKAQSDVG